MKTRRKHNTTRFGVRNLATACVIVTCFFVGAAIAEENAYDITLALSYPAGDKSAPQPTCLYVDSHTGDIFVTDASNSRIAIYDSQRRYNFEFSTRDRVSSPRQVAVDSQGRIFVLGDTRQHTLAVFDYNGEFLNYVDLMADGNRVEPEGFGLDSKDNLYVLKTLPARVFAYNSNGELQREFPILLEADEETQTAQVIGTFTIIGDEMILPMPIIGQVARVGLDGKLIRIFGVPGGGPTELSFPAACARTVNGEFAVLDKHRHLILFFSAEGVFLREVGGAGMVEGWFFHPTSLVCCSDGTLLVGQMYNNRIQSVVFRNAPVVSGS